MLPYTSQQWETLTRPDIAFVVGNVARFCSNPTEEHWVAVKLILRHLKGTTSYGLEHSRNNDDEFILSGYSDASWAGEIKDQKSTSGYL